MSLDNDYFGRLPIDRYGLSMDTLLVDYINHQNNRKLDVRDIVFTTPVPTGTDGMVTVGVNFAAPTGWENSNGSLTYKRQLIADAVPNAQFTVHTEQVDEETVLDAVYKQYGFYLDEDTYLCEECDEAGVPLPPIDPDNPPVIDLDDDRWFMLTLTNDHLLLEGSILIRRVRSIALLGTTISRLLDIRQYYTDITSKRFPVELYLKNFNLSTGSVLGQSLYYVSNTNPELDAIMQTLKELTHDEWMVQETHLDYNLVGCQILYNGLSSTEYTTTDDRYPYVLVIQLSEFCDNLQGVISINYRNDRKQYPGFVGGRVTRPIGILK